MSATVTSPTAATTILDDAALAAFAARVRGGVIRRGGPVMDRKDNRQ